MESLRREQCSNPCRQQSSSLPLLSPLIFSTPCVLYCVVGVRFLADPDIDEVFAKIMLEPVVCGRESGNMERTRLGDASDDKEDQENNKVRSVNFFFFIFFFGFSEESLKHTNFSISNNQI